MKQEKTIFNVKSEKLRGYARFTFEHNTLTELKMNFKEPLSAVQQQLFRINFPFQINDLDGFRKLGFSVVQKDAKKRMENGDKVALWCKAYNAYLRRKYKDAADRPGSYRMMPKEIGMLGNADFTAELLEAYFSCDDWWCRTKSVGNFVSHLNETALLLLEPAPEKKHPAAYDRDYERKLDGAALTDYRRHLRELGLQPVKNKTGQIVDWK